MYYFLVRPAETGSCGVQQSKASGFLDFVSSGHPDRGIPYLKPRVLVEEVIAGTPNCPRQGSDVNISPKKPKLKEGVVSVAWVLVSKSAEESEIQF